MSKHDPHTSTEPQELNTIPKDFDLTEEYPRELRELLEDAVQSLKQTNEAWQMRLHLAGMEAKDLKNEVGESLESLTSRLKQFTKSVDRKLDEGQVQLHLGLKEAQDQWQLTKEHADELLTVFKQDQNKAQEFLKELRLQAKLAGKGSRAFAKDRGDELKTSLTELANDSKKTLVKMNQNIKDFLKSIQVS